MKMIAGSILILAATVLLRAMAGGTTNPDSYLLIFPVGFLFALGLLAVISGGVAKHSNQADDS